jgi:pimeloyl-ACP methyl ester carboxylesterase
MEKPKAKHLEKCRSLEYQILEQIGLPIEHFDLKECELNMGRYIHYIHIYKTEQKPDNVLLVTHGYLHSHISYFKMYPGLIDHFHIISFDLPGQGLSSNDKETPTDIQGWIDYFLGDIKLFVDKLGLEKFHIMGHSLGAYLLTHFANRFPDQILKMFLLSPAGVNKQNDEFIKNGKQFLKNQGWGINFVANKVIKKMFEAKKSPMDFFGVSPFRKFIARKIFTSDRFRLNKNEQKLFSELFGIIFKNKPSSERCGGYIFNYGPMSDVPIMPVFEKLHKEKEIYIFFGALDWIDFELTSKRIEEKKLNIHYKHIDNCGHQIPLQNPTGAVQEILMVMWGLQNTE